MTRLLVPLAALALLTNSAARSQGEGDRAAEHAGAATPRPTATLSPDRPSPSASPRSSRTRVPARPIPPRRDTLNWHALRECESSGNYKTDTGNGYYGAYQFDLSTWRSVGGHGNPAQASPDEQDRRAQLLYAVRGAQPWPVCGRRL